MKRKRANSNSGPSKRGSNWNPLGRAPADRSASQVLRAQKTEIVASRKSGSTENKVTQTVFQNYVTTAGYVHNITSLMSPGTDPINQYVGNEVLPSSLRIHYTISVGPITGVGDGTNVARVLVLQWKDSSTPATSGIFATPAWPQSQFFWNNIENFNVLADRMHVFKQDNAGNGYDIIGEKIYVKGKKMLPIRFNSTTGYVQKNNIFVVLVTDSSVSPNPYVTLAAQLTFTDS